MYDDELIHGSFTKTTQVSQYWKLKSLPGVSALSFYTHHMVDRNKKMENYSLGSNPVALLVTD